MKIVSIEMVVDFLLFGFQQSPLRGFVVTENFNRLSVTKYDTLSNLNSRSFQVVTLVGYLTFVYNILE